MTTAADWIAAIVLAAGCGTRMGTINKLLVEVDGRPLMAWAVDAAMAARLRPVVVVVGHRRSELRGVLETRPVTIVENFQYEQGLSTSIRAGIAALPPNVRGAVFLLADMPRIRCGHIDRLISAFATGDSGVICVPTYEGKRGNPVLWGANFFSELHELSGDVGGRTLMQRHVASLKEVEMMDDAVLIDVDNAGDLQNLLAAQQIC